MRRELRRIEIGQFYGEGCMWSLRHHITLFRNEFDHASDIICDYDEETREYVFTAVFPLVLPIRGAR